MEVNYCGRSCDDCEYQERIQCSGCKTGPGSEEADICELASCSRLKGNASCQTCDFSSGCGKLEFHKTTPQYIRTKLLAEKNRKEQVKTLSGLVGKWQLMFFVAIAVVVTNFFYIIGVYLGSVIGTICGVISTLGALAYAGIVFSMNSVNSSYSIAGLCTGGASLISLIVTFMSEDNIGIAAIFSICSVVLSLVGMYKEYAAHSEVLEGVSEDLSKSWRTLWVWYLVVNVADLLVGSSLVVIMLLASLAVGILRFVNLYKTAVLFEELQEERGKY